MTTEEVNEYVGERIRERRKALGMTQSALAARLGLSPSWVKLAETGRRGLPVPRLVAAAEVLGAAPGDLLPAVRNCDDVPPAGPACEEQATAGVRAEDVNAAFAAGLTRLRTERWWTKTKLAEVSGVSVVTISEAERRKRGVTLATADALAAALGTTVDGVTGRRAAEVIPGG